MKIAQNAKVARWKSNLAIEFGNYLFDHVRKDTLV